MPVTISKRHTSLLVMNISPLTTTKTFTKPASKPIPHLSVDSQARPKMEVSLSLVTMILVTLLPISTIRVASVRTNRARSLRSFRTLANTTFSTALTWIRKEPQRLEDQAQRNILVAQQAGLQ